MSLPEDTLPVGAPYAIGAAFFAALETALTPKGVKTLDNPKRLSDLDDGSRIVFYEDVSDRGVDQPGGKQQRTFSFNIGAINRTEAARLGVHQDYRAAKRVVLDALKALKQSVTVISVLREACGPFFWRVS